MDEGLNKKGIGKFSLLNTIKKSKIKTKFGILTINNIYINPVLFEEYISELVNDIKNLEFIFNQKIVDDYDKIVIIKRFIPSLSINNIEQYVKNEISKNHNFYSFLAEALLSIVLKDIYGYEITKSVVDVTSTLCDSHTGADVCMIDKENKIFILGEAKFYSSFSRGIQQIIKDFTGTKGFINKLESFYRTNCANRDAIKIFLKEINKSLYEEHTIHDFLKMKINFSGFVLHEHSGKTDKYFKKDFYDNLFISVDDIEKNISNLFELKLVNPDYSIDLFHIPINSKSELIVNIIRKALIIMDIKGGD